MGNLESVDDKFEKQNFSEELVERINNAKSLEELLQAFQDTVNSAAEKGTNGPLYMHPNRGMQPIDIILEDASTYINAIKMRGVEGMEETAEGAIASYQNYGFPPEFIERARILSSQ